jgi:CRP-like cAMP-binding protein
LDFVYFPGTAVVSEFRMLEDGRIVEVAVTGRDGAVGLSSFLLGSNLAGNTTQVSQTGTAERISVWALATLLDSNADVRPSLNPFADRYIRQISQKVICNMYHPAKERLCTWLLMAQDWRRSDTMRLTHEQMARILGVLRPTVTFIAQELRKTDLIDYSRGEISICDRKRLQQSACACYLAPGWAP